MAANDLKALMDRILQDDPGSDEFRRTLTEDPAAALKSIGIDPTKEQVEALSGLDYKSLRNFAESFGVRFFTVMN